MFEKEFEEYKNLPKWKGKIFMKDEETCYKDGVNFGFQKGIKARINTTTISKDGWHFIKDGDLPKDEEYKWCISRSGYPYVAKYEELFVSWRSQENKDVLCPYAWKEIVLPTELKECEV